MNILLYISNGLLFSIKEKEKSTIPFQKRNLTRDGRQLRFVVEGHGKCSRTWKQPTNSYHRWPP
jgi:hypothetical protein